MTKLNSPECPNPETLSNFLLGKLDPEASYECESHLAKSDPCVETVNGLNINDTFHSLIIDSPAQEARVPVGDQSIVSNLIHRMVDAGNKSHPRKNLDQRAADVIATLEPANTPDAIGQIEHYRIEKVLGCGSTGVVFQAVDENLDRAVAIKVLRPTLGDAAKDRFIEEAKATAKLDHANIVTIFHVGESSSVAFIVMQWLPGETLEERLERDSILKAETVKSFGVQIASGLSAAHRKGLVHRDIKPANLWITRDEQVKILDFGLVRIMDESPQLTCTGMIAGTPCYMSPEQSRGDELDARSDLFSLGCVLYRSLTGKLPFESSNALATLQAIQRVQPESPLSLEPTTDTDLSDLVMCLLEKSPYRRPDSASDVAAAFEVDRAQWPFDCDATSDCTKPKAALTKPQLTKPFPLFPIATLALLAAVMGWAAFMFGPQIIRIATNKGEIFIESNDPDVEIEILSGGQQIQIVDLKTKQNIEIKSGNYEIRAVGDQNSISIDKETLTLSRGESEIVTVTRMPTSETASNVPKNIKTSLANPVTVRSSGSAPTLELPTQQTTTQSNQLATGSSQLIDPHHKVGPGDVLAVFIEHVFGSLENGNANAGNYLGLPVPVRGDGAISLPLIEPFNVDGKTAVEIENALRKKYIGGEFIDKSRGSHISVSVKSIYGGTSQKLLSQPVFAGKTFEQHFNALKFERHSKELEKSVEGITALKSAKSNPELIDPMLQAVLQIRRTTSGSAATTQFLHWLTEKQLQELVVRSLSGNSRQEWSLANNLTHLRWERLQPIEDQLVSVALDAIDRERIEDWPVEYLVGMLKRGTASKKTIERVVDPLLQNLDLKKNSHEVLSAVIEVRPKTKGLGVILSNSMEHYSNRLDVDWSLLISNLEEEEMKQAIGAYTRLLLKKKSWALQRGKTNLLAIVPDSVFAIAKEEFDLAIELHPNTVPSEMRTILQYIAAQRNRRRPRSTK